MGTKTFFGTRPDGMSDVDWLKRKESMRNSVRKDKVEELKRNIDMVKGKLQALGDEDIIDQEIVSGVLKKLKEAQSLLK